MSKIKLEYDVDEKPRSTRDSLIYTIQWIVTMFYCVVWGYALVGVGIGFTGEELARYMATVVFMTGLCTLIQTLIGHKFAMVSGPTVVPSIAILTAYAIGGKEYALMAFPAQAIAGVIIFLLGVTGIMGAISKIWTPLVSGSFVMMIGIAVAKSAVSSITAYGPGWPMWVGLALALIAGLISVKGKGLISTLPTLILIVAGYLVFIIAGEFNWGLVKSLPLISTPKLFPYGIETPPSDLIVMMTIVSLMVALSLIGILEGWASLVGRSVTSRQMKRTFSILGLVETSLAGILGVPGYVPYAENIGITTLTRVASKYFVLFASVVFLLLGFIGPVGGFMAAMPMPVAGAILLGIASTVIGIGASTWMTQEFKTREIFIVGFSIVLAVGLSQLPSTFWDQTPRMIATVFSNPLISVPIIVMILEQIFFRKPKLESRTNKRA